MTDARKGVTALALLAVVGLTLFLASSLRLTSPIADLADTLIGPLQRAVSSIGYFVDDFSASIISAGKLEQENKRLQQEILRLQAENAKLQSLQKENEELRQQLGFARARTDLKMLNAMVIARDPTAMHQYLVIDKGSADGVWVGQAVVHPGGALVGQIMNVEQHRSQVLLITDIDSSVSAEIARTQADGVLEGRWQRGGLLELRYIEVGKMPDGQPRVKAGDWVVTGHLGGIVPSGLLIGQVKSVKSSDSGLEQVAEVIPAVDIRSVDRVLVVSNT